MTQIAAEQEAYEIRELWEPEWFTKSDHERFRSLGDLIPGDCLSLLDVGCGNGLFLDHLSGQRTWQRLCGVDRSQQALMHVRHEKFEVEVDSLPFDDNEFDIVSCQEVLEHLPGATFDAAVSEICRVARKAALISVPFNEDLLRGHVQCPYCQTRFHPDYHMRSFDESAMNELLDRHCFKAVQIAKIHPLRVSWHYHLFSRDRNRGDKREFPSFAICPTCYYKNTDRLGDELEERRRSHSQTTQPLGAVQRLKRLLVPSFESHRWISGLYVSADDDG